MNIRPLKDNPHGRNGPRDVGAVMETRYWPTEKAYAALRAASCTGRHCREHPLPEHVGASS